LIVLRGWFLLMLPGGIVAIRGEDF
jgi:hypothetical protein